MLVRMENIENHQHADRKKVLVKIGSTEKCQLKDSQKLVKIGNAGNHQHVDGENRAGENGEY
jgi:hypothetical protein